jgi:hypothetical protein
MTMFRVVTKAMTLATLLAVASVLPANAGSTRDIVPVSAAVQAPSDDQIVELAHSSMRTFMQSVREKSMTAFWNHISPRFRENYSVAQLDEGFKEFYNLPITGDPLAGKSPIFTEEPKVDGNSVLIVRGFYATTPSRVIFQLVYGMEGRAWKLIGIQVNVKPISTARSEQSADAGAAHRNRIL